MAQQIGCLLYTSHLMTRKDYDVEHLINILKDFHARYPHLKVIMEPGLSLIHIWG